MEIASRRLGKTVFWVILLIMWLAFCAELLREVWHLETWRRAAFYMLAAMGVYWIWRSGLCTYLKASPTALTVRNRFTRWHIPFDDIADMTWIPGEGPQLTLRSGPTVRLDAYAGWPAGQLGRQVMADLVEARRSRPDGTPEVSSRRRASGMAELLLVCVCVWCEVVLQTAS
ncbi:hypothetical protein HLK59_45490 [Streptomyces sp. S3(2020)]|uniref:hypothetical protein n=1 Tax=Streptomyces sp. S3(2020) TaxID=2732044 RepID=UPI0014891F49|nr:hypothetical protein [Streptomyces sp. S3(2020)]NNN37464.1 hypothetical protein [Streptomyces sp. S3(2020)]